MSQEITELFVIVGSKPDAPEMATVQMHTPFVPKPIASTLKDGLETFASCEETVTSEVSRGFKVMPNVKIKLVRFVRAETIREIAIGETQTSHAA